MDECQWCGRAQATANNDGDDGGGRTTGGDHEMIPDIDDRNDEEEQAMPNICSHCLKRYHAQGPPRRL
jgi:hypothetical protein